jgi:uncharacterized protein
MNLIAHFAINADDVSATRRFYEQVFGWRFSPWGPPDFYHISADPHARTGADAGADPGSGAGGGAGGGAIIGALQKRRDLVPGQPTIGYECTIAVADVDEAARLVTANGGQVLMERTTIAGVGDLIFFTDPSGNVVGAMRFDPTAE